MESWIKIKHKQKIKIKNKVEALQWPSQRLNPSEMVWYDFKQAIHASKPSSVAEFCKEKWAKIPVI